jgi:hypothetical protein
MANNEQHHRDSCLYSVEIAKQFIALAIGGVAFVVATAIASTNVPNTFFWSATLFVVSIGFGLGYVMSVIAHINKAENYDVYTVQLKFIAAIQMLTFFASVVLLVYVVLWKLNNNAKLPSVNGPTISVISGNNTLTQQQVSNKDVEITINTQGEINFKTTIKKP